MLMLRLGITKQISRDTWSQLLEFARVRYKKDYYILHHYLKIKCLCFIYTCICNHYPFRLLFYLLKLKKYDMHCAASPSSTFLIILEYFILKVAFLLCRVGEIYVSRTGERDNLSLTSFDTWLPSLMPFVSCILLISQTEQSYSYLHFYFGILTSHTTKMRH